MINLKISDNKLLKNNFKRLLWLMVLITAICFGIRSHSSNQRIQLPSISCYTNMRGIVFSCYQYYYKYGSFPSYTIDENNKPLHSWRVLLLPDIGEKELYDKIRLDEPWNSEYNSQFHDYVVPLYQCRSSINRKKGRTNYFLVTGEGSLFDKSGKLIMDSENQRILLVESSKDVNWMCPVDISYTEYKSSKFVPAAKYHFNLANNDLGVQRIISEPFYLYLDSIEIFFLCVLFALCVIVILRVCYIVILLFYIRS